MKKADDKNETILELDFSDNFGFTYYTDDKECSSTYIGLKVNEGEGNGKVALAIKGIYDKNKQLLHIVIPPYYFFLLFYGIALCSFGMCEKLYIRD